MTRKLLYKISLGFLIFFAARLAIESFVDFPDLVDTIFYSLGLISPVAAIGFAIAGHLAGPEQSTGIERSKAVPITIIMISLAIILMMVIGLLAVFAWKNSFI